jgi:hypothetical protein
MAIQIQGNTVIYNDRVFQVGAGTTAQRPASPQAGMIRFNTDLGSYEGYDGSEWSSIGGSGGIDDVFYENAQTIAANYTLVTGRNAMTAGPVTINNGVTVTVQDGSRWVVV